MKNPTPSLTTCAVVMASCLAWIGAIAIGAVWMFQLSETAGWVLGAGLSFIAVLFVTMLLYEMRHAIELPPDFDDGFHPVPRPTRRPAAPAVAPRGLLRTV